MTGSWFAAGRRTTLEFSAARFAGASWRDGMNIAIIGLGHVRLRVLGLDIPVMHPVAAEVTRLKSKKIRASSRRLLQF
jgi:hypothetical protein